MYVLRTDAGHILVVLVYVDDLVIASSCRALRARFATAISGRFKMKDLGGLRRAVGCEVHQDTGAHSVLLTLSTYMLELACSYH